MNLFQKKNVCLSQCTWGLVYYDYLSKGLNNNDEMMREEKINKNWKSKKHKKCRKFGWKDALTWTEPPCLSVGVNVPAAPVCFAVSGHVATTPLPPPPPPAPPPVTSWRKNHDEVANAKC